MPICLSWVLTEAAKPLAKKAKCADSPAIWATLLHPGLKIQRRGLDTADRIPMGYLNGRESVWPTAAFLFLI